MICENPKCKKRSIIKSNLIILVFCLVACSQPQIKEETHRIIDLPQIKERDTLTIAIHYNPVDYYIYDGEPKGFQYELLAELSKQLGLYIELKIGDSFSENMRWLDEGKCDLIASSLVMPEIDTLVGKYTNSLYATQQVLIQRKPSRWKKMTSEKIEKALVRDGKKLNGKMVYVSGLSSLTDGQDFVTDRHIRITKLNGINSEQLIDLVAEGELDYAICNQYIARHIVSRYQHLDASTELGELPVGWIVRHSSKDLLNEINQWLSGFRKTDKYAVLYKKYHKSKSYYAKSGTDFQISEYDNLFKKYSKNIGWDWRLLASLVFQESRFNPLIKSNKGAFGLMQLMPATLETFGVDTASSPERHIAAGVEYIKYLDKIIAPKVVNDEERIKFILASYNIGPGHVFDAQRLAAKYGKDAEVWGDNVDSCLLSKAHPQFYNDPEVKHGRCKGKQTYQFVIQILERYEHYKNIVRY